MFSSPRSTPTGTARLYSTYLGSTGVDNGRGIAVNSRRGSLCDRQRRLLELSDEEPDTGHVGRIGRRVPHQA